MKRLGKDDRCVVMKAGDGYHRGAPEVMKIGERYTLNYAKKLSSENERWLYLVEANNAIIQDIIDFYSKEGEN